MRRRTSISSRLTPAFRSSTASPRRSPTSTSSSGNYASRRRGITFDQDDVEIDGHSMEFRINAENAADDFAPATGGTSRRTTRRAVSASASTMRSDRATTSSRTMTR